MKNQSLMITRRGKEAKFQFQQFCAERGLVQNWVVNKALDEYMEKVIGQENNPATNKLCKQGRAVFNKKAILSAAKKAGYLAPGKRKRK